MALKKTRALVVAFSALAGFLLLLPTADARLMCLRLANDIQADGNYWYTVQGASHQVYNEFTQLEWEIWADVTESTNKVRPVWPWNAGVNSHNNTVLDLVTGDYLHLKWTKRHIYADFDSGFDTQRSEAFWKIRMSGSDELGVNFGILQVLFSRQAKSVQPWTSVMSSDFSDWRVTMAFETGWWSSNIVHKFVGINEENNIVTNCTPK